MKSQRLFTILLVCSITFILLSACNRSTLTPTDTSKTEVATGTTVTLVEPSQTPVPPTSTPTPIPLAALVNGEAITLDDYMGELTRFKAASGITGTNIASDPGVIVLDELINQTLLAQAAEQNGFIVDDALIQSRIETLSTQLGSAQALDEWKTEHGYSNEDFQMALRRAIGAAWMRDQISTAVPETAEQVHVKQILFDSIENANEVYSSLQTGADFLDLADTNNPVTGGELGWFPRGYLDESAIEEAAFSLQPEQFSPVIETEIGYHILYLVERDDNRSLQPDAKMVLQIAAIRDWITERRNQSDIQILLP